MVAQYYYHIRPEQSLIFYNMLGEAANIYKNKDIRDREEKEAFAEVRRGILIRMIHDIHEAERAILSIDWPGFELTGSEEEAENLVRWYLRTFIDQKINAAVPMLLAGKMNLEEYQKFTVQVRSDFQRMLQIDLMGGSPEEFLTEAEEYFKQFGGDENVKKARSYDKNPLYELLTEK